MNQAAYHLGFTSDLSSFSRPALIEKYGYTLKSFDQLGGEETGRSERTTQAEGVGIAGTSGLTCTRES
jgi:hypothetical protein